LCGYPEPVGAAFLKGVDYLRQESPSQELGVLRFKIFFACDCDFLGFELTIYIFDSKSSRVALSAISFFAKSYLLS
jgi:hypothetical protein